MNVNHTDVSILVVYVKVRYDRLQINCVACLVFLCIFYIHHRYHRHGHWHHICCIANRLMILLHVNVMQSCLDYSTVLRLASYHQFYRRNFESITEVSSHGNEYMCRYINT